MQSGFPFNVYTTAPFAAGGDYNGDGVNTDRPNTPSFGTDLDASRDDYIAGLFTAADFPRPDVLGDLPRNAYRGPGYASTDFSFFKNFLITDSTRVQFRFEMFNAFNRVNLRLPEGRMNQGTFGRSTESFPAREIQFGLKFIW